MSPSFRITLVHARAFVSRSALMSPRVAVGKILSFTSINVLSHGLRKPLVDSNNATCCNLAGYYKCAPQRWNECRTGSSSSRI